MSRIRLYQSVPSTLSFWVIILKEASNIQMQNPLKKQQKVQPECLGQFQVRITVFKCNKISCPNLQFFMSKCILEFSWRIKKYLIICRCSQTKNLQVSAQISTSLALVHFLTFLIFKQKKCRTTYGQNIQNIANTVIITLGSIIPLGDPIRARKTGRSAEVPTDFQVIPGIQTLFNVMTIQKKYVFNVTVI